MDEFFRLAKLQGIPAAYDNVARRLDERGEAENPYAARAYKEIVEELKDRPHVCIRVPTGGGKTYLAACALPLTARYMERTHPTVLWFAGTTDAIRRQTVAMLKDRDHPCRRQMEENFGMNVIVYDIEDFDIMRPQDFVDKVCVIVSTAQMFRVRRTFGRRIYKTNEHFESHFNQFLPSPPPPDLERDENGDIKYSFVNLLHLLRPMVVLDEAHNFISDLSYDVLRRINPACVVEWTATPKDKDKIPLHNVLVSVAAEKLQTEEMVKLPVQVTEHSGWEQAVNGALLERKKLAAAVADVGDTIRPIILYQAQSRDQNITPQVLRAHLIDNENVAEETIAIATAEMKELPADLLSPSCKIEHIITIDALREGWDCPFAYILCALSNTRSAAAIEQLLGRVMRMPFAERRRHDALNRAYCHVPKDAISDAVADMREKIAFGLGFEDGEAKWAVQGALDIGGAWEGDIFCLAVEAKPNFDALPKEAKKAAHEAVEVRPKMTPQGKSWEVRISAPIPEEVSAAIITAVPENRKVREESRLQQANRRLMENRKHYHNREMAPLPQLIFYSPEEGKEVIADYEALYLQADWNNIGDDILLEEFAIKENAEQFIIYLQGGQVRHKKGDDYLLPLLEGRGQTMERRQLASWLEREIRCPRARYSSATLKKLVAANVDDLLAKWKLEQLVRAKYQLAEALQQWLKAHEQKTMEKTEGMFLFDNPKLKCQDGFQFPKNYEPGNRCYTGSFDFQKHLFPVIGDLRAKGEEFICAQAIDAAEEVKVWVRNMPHGGYCLPLGGGGNFYPDFAAELKNGKKLIVEYKGAFLADGSDSDKKKHIGEKLEEASGGTTGFLMVTKQTNEPMSAIAKQVADKIRKMCG